MIERNEYVNDDIDKSDNGINTPPHVQIYKHISDDKRYMNGWKCRVITIK